MEQLCVQPQPGRESVMPLLGGGLPFSPINVLTRPPQLAFFVMKRLAYKWFAPYF